MRYAIIQPAIAGRRTWRSSYCWEEGNGGVQLLLGGEPHGGPAITGRRGIEVQLLLGEGEWRSSYCWEEGNGGPAIAGRRGMEVQLLLAGGEWRSSYYWQEGNGYCWEGDSAITSNVIHNGGVP